MAERCPTCDQEFETRELLQGHMHEEHGHAADGQLEDALPTLLQHDVPPEDAVGVGERFTCPECGAELSSRDSLDTHRHDAHVA